MRVDWEKGDDGAGTGDVGPGVTLAPGRSLTQWKWSVRLETEVLKPSERAVPRTMHLFGDGWSRLVLRDVSICGPHGSWPWRPLTMGSQNGFYFNILSVGCLDLEIVIR